MRFERPHFVSPHAMQRFREYVGPRSDPAIIEAINRSLQPPRLPDDVDLRPRLFWELPALYYALTIDRKPVTAVVRPGKGDWPAVVTLVEGHERIERYRQWRGRKWDSKMSRRMHVLREWGFTPGECAEILKKPEMEVLKRWPKQVLTVS